MSGVKRDCACPRARHAHGTRGGYQADRCRCFPCRLAYSQMKAAYANGKSCQVGTASLVGTQRRLQALHAVGWSLEAIAQRLGTSRQAVSQLAHGKRAGDTVFGFTAARIGGLYDAVWDQRPGGVAALRACRNAARHGWLPPLAWDDDTIDDPAARPNVSIIATRAVDEVAVERAMNGDPVKLTKAERAEAVRRLTAAGVGAAQIGARLGTTGRTVQRDRSADRKEAAA